MNALQRQIRVYADWTESSCPHLMGTLGYSRVRGKDVFSFVYADAWLAGGRALEIDPDLRLFSGTQYLKPDKPNFGVFTDSSPDRWGRMLMRRREAVHAEKEGRDIRSLSELDYLLGVYDRQRMGAIRFQEGSSDRFLNADERLATPPWASLRGLEHASLMLDREDGKPGGSEAKWLSMLLAPGSSLGGARPKAGVVDEAGCLWIAKFPCRSDEWDTGAWEFVVHALARDAGLSVPDAKYVKLGSRHHTFLTKRFDRTSSGRRRHFASAMTLTGSIDGADASSGASYLELADLIIRKGAAASADLAELWGRLVFNLCVSNTDDHLRNHGFLLVGQDGWRLSPAYDVNANPDGDALTLNITEGDNRLALELAMAVAEAFRVESAAARIRMEEIRRAVGRWRAVASHVGISRAQQDRMAPAFRLAWM